MKKQKPLEQSIKDQLATRSETTLRTLLGSEGAQTYFVTSPDDLGVARNGGKKGARFAPQAILASLLSYQNNLKREIGGIKIQELENSTKQSGLGFVELQRLHAKKWEEIFGHMNSTMNFIHLGGGHDHIYPLLSGFNSHLERTKDKRGIAILNLDAHLDTRTDKAPHSGTPFRQFAQECKRPIHMIQWGIHHSANSKATCQALPSPHKTSLITLEETQKIENAGDYIRNLAADNHLIVSLDADAIDGSELGAVSAVNPRGLRSTQVFDLVSDLSRDAQVFGIYEYNPIYDDLSNYGARMLAKLALTFMER